MKNRREWLYWSIPVVCAVAQLAAAAVDYTVWTQILPDQTLVICSASCIVLPVLVVGFLTSWLFALGFKFERQARIGLLWNSIKAKMLYFGILIGLIGLFSLLGGMLPASEFPVGIISLSCLVILPPLLAFTYEYHGCRTILPGKPKRDIIAYIAVAVVFAVVVVIVLVLAILLALFLYAGLGIFVS